MADLAGLRTEEAFRTLAGDCLAKMAKHEAGALAHDAESLHKLRVGVRQLRALFTTFKPALVSEEVADLREELRWLQAVLGSCRDWDVFNARNLLPLQERLGEVRPLHRFTKLGLHAREDAYDALADSAKTKRYRAIPGQLRGFLDTIDQAGTKWMRRPVKKFANRAIRKRLRKVSVSKDLRTLPDADIHELRKNIKKARYAVGFFADLYRKKRAKRYLERLARMQDLSGALVDVRAGLALLEELHPRGDADRRALEAGRYIVAGWMTANTTACRARLCSAWEAFQDLKPLR